MKETNPTQVVIKDPFWSPLLEVNATRSIYHQWQMLEASGCIDNFRIAAGEKEGFRLGWFFADSDAYKWLDAAARIERNHHDAKLCKLMDDFISLLSRTQMKDGYLFTYNQVHFPGQRWVNLQVEHELYCHGHFIEAGVSHYQATGLEDLLKIARKAADLIVKDFLQGGPADTPGHEEIEIALLRLHEVTGHRPYRELALHFIEQRGRDPFFGLALIGSFTSSAIRGKFVSLKQQKYERTHPGELIARVPATNEAKRPRYSLLRYILSGLSGKYFQQHRPVRGQTAPVGHAVRFGYLKTAEARSLRGHGNVKHLRTLQKAWERMVTRRMDVSGGLGALPVSEGFGRDYELDPETTYNETCAGIASLYWNWQLACLTAEAKYSDLFEWQLYNSVLAGVGIEGNTYLYNNPTSCRGGIQRQPWYSIPCCPSNISRTLADLGGYLCITDANDLWLHQYIGGHVNLEENIGVDLTIRSGLPASGEVEIDVDAKQPHRFTLWLRKPSWAGTFAVSIDGKIAGIDVPNQPVLEPTAAGYDPRASMFIPIERDWHGKTKLRISMSVPIRVLHPHTEVKGLHGRVAVTRGPLLYCLESVDNPGLDLFSELIDVNSLHYEYRSSLLGGTGVILGQTANGHALTFLPYHLWGDRGPSQMNVWVFKP
jgi:uncharacterized protein